MMETGQMAAQKTSSRHESSRSRAVFLVGLFFFSGYASRDCDGLPSTFQQRNATKDFEKQSPHRNGDSIDRHLFY